MNTIINEPTEAENKAALEHFFKQEVENRRARRAAAQLAKAALPDLLAVMRNRSGQSYKLRAMLWSLYNGKPASLAELLNLDFKVRAQLCAFLLGFGWEDGIEDLFYAELKSALAADGQWEWFVEESEVQE